MDKVLAAAGDYQASIRSHKTAYTKDGTPKVTILWDIGQTDGIFQDLTMKESAAKFLKWQLDILGVTDKCNLATEFLQVKAKSIDDSLGAVVGNKYMISLSYRDFNGKDYASVAIKSKVMSDIEALAVAKAQDINPVGGPNSVGGVDTSEPLPF
jgi:hypothetical protein